MKQRKPEDHLLLQQQAKELSERLYPTIGEFAVSFEAISHAIRCGIDILLQKNGLHNSRVTNILVGDFTMQPLQAAYRALLVETEKLDESEISVLDDIFKRVNQITEHRNRILHSSWFIDFKNPEELRNGLLLSYKPGRTKKGAKDCPTRVAIQEIKDIIQEVRTVDDLVHQLNMCIYTRRKIGQRFAIGPKGKVVATGSIGDFFGKKR